MKENELLSDLKDWRLMLDQEGIAWATFDREGESANALGRRPIEELMKIVGRVEEGARNGEVVGLVLQSGKEKGFIVGADIREFESLDTEAKVIEGIMVGRIIGSTTRVSRCSTGRSRPGCHRARPSSS